MKRFAVLAALAASALFPAAVLASEATRPDDVIVRLLGTDPSVKKASACFVRVYDAAHLAQHQKQKVTAMMLLVSGEPDAETKTVTYSFDMGVRLRGSSRRLVSAGDCNHSVATTEAGKSSATFGCGVDCDGGGFAVTLSDDAKSVLLTLEYGVAIWPPGEEDPEKRSSLEAGADDHAFQLMRANLTDCLPLTATGKEAMR
jgi:hypothetical protein